MKGSYSNVPPPSKWFEHEKANISDNKQIIKLIHTTYCLIFS